MLLCLGRSLIFWSVSVSSVSEKSMKSALMFGDWVNTIQSLWSNSEFCLWLLKAEHEDAIKIKAVSARNVVECTSEALRAASGDTVVGKWSSYSLRPADWCMLINPLLSYSTFYSPYNLTLETSKCTYSFLTCVTSNVAVVNHDKFVSGTFHILVLHYLI